MSSALSAVQTPYRSTTAMAPLSINSTLRMNSGYEIPMLGYGLYQTPSHMAENAVSRALKAGYRQIDSALVYANEGPCGAAIKKSNLPRTSIFFVSKVFPPLSYETSKRQLRTTLSDSGLSYLDLCLIHHPGSGREDRKGAWKALVEAQREGLVRSIGVSNYGLHHLQEMEGYQQELEEEGGKGAGGTIDVGQWELQPWLGRKDIVNWCRERNIVLQAYSPLLQGKRFDDPLLKPLVEKHRKTPAQILLRWSLQKGFVPLPKSVTPARIVENTLLYDFELDEVDMASLETGAYESCTWDPTLLPLEQRYKSHLSF